MEGLVMQVSTDAQIQDLKDSILRTVHMVTEDFKRKSDNEKFIDDVIQYALWFEEKYKCKFRTIENNFCVKKGEIYNCNFGRNIGSEQDKWRPAIVLQNNTGNLHSPTTIVAPITDEIKANLPTHVDIADLKADCNVHGIILIEQLKCISKLRLSNLVDCIDVSSQNWNKIIRAIKIELDASYNIKKH
jgi:mRNA interferase MazF